MKRLGVCTLVALWAAFMVAGSSSCTVLDMPDRLREMADAQDRYFAGVERSLEAHSAGIRSQEQTSNDIKQLTEAFKGDLEDVAERVEKSIEADKDLISTIGRESPGHIATGLLAWLLTNMHRDRRRRKRGEPIHPPEPHGRTAA